MEQYQNTVQTIQNTVNTNKHITKTTIHILQGADKVLSQPGRKQANVSVRMA